MQTEWFCLCHINPRFCRYNWVQLPLFQDRPCPEIMVCGPVCCTFDVSSPQRGQSVPCHLEIAKWPQSSLVIYLVYCSGAVCSYQDPRGNGNWKRDLSSVSFISPRQLCETKVRLWLISPVFQLFLLRNRCRKCQLGLPVSFKGISSSSQWSFRMSPQCWKGARFKR